MGDIRTGNELRDGVHAHYTRSIFQDDNVTVLEDFFLCALNWQKFLGSEDREDKESETNECVDGSHRGGWEPLSFPERVTKEGCEGARLEESSQPKVPVIILCQPPGAVRQCLQSGPELFGLWLLHHEERKDRIIHPCGWTHQKYSGWFPRVTVSVKLVGKRMGVFQMY